MEFLLPIDLARLVYGYLSDEGCAEAAKLFMETSPHMKECMMYAAKGRTFNTRVLGLGLAEILDVLAEVTCFVKSVEHDVHTKDITLEDIWNQLKLTLKLSSNEDGVNKPVYLKFTMPSMPKQPHALQVLLDNKALHEKLAENINKVVANKSDIDSLEKILEKEIVETIVNNTEQDPSFHEIIQELVGPGDTEVETPEDTEVENEEAPVQVTEHNIVERAMKTSDVPTSYRSAPHQTPTPQTAQIQAPSNLVSLPIAPHTMLAPPLGSFLEPPHVFPGAPVAPSLTPLTISHPHHPFVAAPTSVSSLTFNASQQPFVVTPSPVSPIAPSMYPVGALYSTPRMAGTVTTSAKPENQTRYRPLHVKTPPQVSSIKVLGPASLPAMSPASAVVKVPPRPSKDPTVKSKGRKVVKPLLTSPALPMTPTPGNLVRVSGVRTRGGKVGCLKTYAGTKKPRVLSPKILTTILEQKSDENESFNASQVVSENSVVAGAPTMEVSCVTPEVPADVETSLSYEASPASTADVSSVTTALTVSVPDMATTGIVSERANEIPSVVASVISVPTSEAVPTVSSSNSESSKLTAAQSPPTHSEAPSVTAGVSRSDSSIVDDAKNATDPTGETVISHSSEVDSKVEPNSASSEQTSGRPDATPMQGSEPRVKLRKRLSLSTPRKGSHVRTLEFKTPPKGSMPRKSLSSPKHKVLERVPLIHEMLQSVKKSELFKSPPKKEKKSWDADLRNYTAEEDIPTSVGLKRKAPTSVAKKTTPISLYPKKQGRRKIRPTKAETPPKPPEKEHEDLGTSEEIVSRIRRDVYDVIPDVEDIVGTNSNSLGANRSLDCADISSTMKSPFLSPGTASLLEIGDIGIPPATIKKLYAKRTPTKDENSSTLGSPPSLKPQGTMFLTGTGLSTPPKVSDTPVKSLPNTPGMVSLEAALIRESLRLENEGVDVAQDGAMSPLPRNIAVGQNPAPISTNEVQDRDSTDASLPPPKGILLLKTPAKTDLMVRVEMTPISKIINEETRLSKCIPLTPTIPPTPDYDVLKNQETSPKEEVSISHDLPKISSSRLMSDHSPEQPPSKNLLDPSTISPKEELTRPPEVSSYTDSSITTNDSPELLPIKKQQKTPSKTPLVRLKTKQKQESLKPKPSTPTRKTPKKKKKGSSEEIECSKLMTSLLQSAKESLWKLSAPEEEIESKSIVSTAAVRRKSPGRKKKNVDMKKIQPEKVSNEECSKLNKVPFGEFIDYHEKSITLSSSSGNDDAEVSNECVNQIESTVDKCTNDDVPKLQKSYQNQIIPSKTKVDVFDAPKKVQQAPSQITKSNGTVKIEEQSTKRDEDETVVKVIEIASPPHSPPCLIEHVDNNQPSVVGKVDLNKFVFPFSVDVDGGMVTHYLRPSACFSLFELPLPSSSAIVVSKASSRPAKLSNDTSKNVGEVYESSRRRKRTDSDSNDERDSLHRKRRRVIGKEREYRAKSPRPSFKRGRGRPRGRRSNRLDRDYERRRLGRPKTKEEERLNRRYLESSDEGSRHSSKSRSRDSSKSRPRSERDRSKSRPRSQRDDRRSPDRSRLKKHPVEPSSYVRKDKLNTLSNETRREPCDSQQRKPDRHVPEPPPRKLKAVPDSPPLRRTEKHDAVGPVSTASSKVGRPKQSSDIEEGEISDTSLATPPFASAKKTSHQIAENISARLSSPVTDDSRQALIKTPIHLKTLDVDGFLDVVHGGAK